MGEGPPAEAGAEMKPKERLKRMSKLHRRFYSADYALQDVLRESKALGLIIVPHRIEGACLDRL